MRQQKLSNTELYSISFPVLTNVHTLQPVKNQDQDQDQEKQYNDIVSIDASLNENQLWVVLPDNTIDIDEIIPLQLNLSHINTMVSRWSNYTLNYIAHHGIEEYEYVHGELVSADDDLYQMDDDDEPNPYDD